MRRGDVVTVSGAGDYGKPRPAVVIQSDFLSDAGLGSETMLRLNRLLAFVVGLAE